MLTRGSVTLLCFIASDVVFALAGLELILQGNHPGGAAMFGAGALRLVGKGIALEVDHLDRSPDRRPENPKKSP